MQPLLETAQDNLYRAEEHKALNGVRLATAYHGESFPYGKSFVQNIVDAKPDGVWGPKSRKALKVWLSKIQRVWAAYGLYKGKIDGIWGPAMETSFKVVERAYYSK
jgi:hypothetical protein